MLNEVTLMGNLGKAPEVKTITGGAKVCRLAMATSSKYKNQRGELVEETTWHDIECWDKLATYAEGYLDKGSRCLVKGAIKSQSWEDEAGKKHYRTFIRAYRLIGLSPKPDGGIPPGGDNVADDGDDLPF